MHCASYHLCRTCTLTHLPAVELQHKGTEEVDSSSNVGLPDASAVSRVPVVDVCGVEHGKVHQILRLNMVGRASHSTVFTTAPNPTWSQRHRRPHLTISGDKRWDSTASSVLEEGVGAVP